MFTVRFAIKMLKSIKRHADCEPGTLLNIRSVEPLFIYHQVSEVYDKYVISDGNVRKYIRWPNKECKNIYDEEWSRGHLLLKMEIQEVQEVWLLQKQNITRTVYNFVTLL